MFATKQAFLESFYDIIKSKYEEAMHKDEEGNDEGWFASMKKQIINNLQIQIKNIHIRMEIFNPLFISIRV